MKRDYYTTPKSNWITKTLWKAAGADEYILMRSTYSDHVKYATLGGIVCATGFMAALAGGYAFYIIFKEKAAAITESSSQVVEQSTDIKTALLSILFGIIWGLIIFNIDRFIVASTGKGDGTEAITWGEFRGAIPRIIMGIIIAITISKPVELRMFETEIDVKLHEKQQIEYNNQIKKVEMNFRPEVERIEDEIEALRSEISLQRENLERKTTIFQAEMDGRGGSGKKGKGPSAREKERERDLAQSELDALIAKNEPKIGSLIEDKKAAQNKIKLEKAKAENVANGLNGLLERLHIAHEIAGFWITLFITLLFMAIELTPIFFKMMLIKSPYDFMNDNLKALLKAEQGIEVKYDFYKDKEGIQRDLVIYHQSEKMIREKVKLLQTQADLNEIVLEEWKNKEAANIKKDASKYMDS
jgi:TM2 domain-containing membrane protein YozV